MSPNSGRCYVALNRFPEGNFFGNPEKINPGYLKLFFPLAINGVKFKLKFLTKFSNFIPFNSRYHNRFLANFKAQQSSLVHGFTQRDYTPGKDNHFN